jgi:3-methyladenine DNA glycosylase AlkD
LCPTTGHPLKEVELTIAQSIDVPVEVAAITATLKKRRDPEYEAGMRRTVPSGLPAHAVRVPTLRKVALEWLRAHKEATGDEVIRVAEALWAVKWREEMLVGVGLLAHSRAAMAALPWEVVERWSAELENWEQVDHLAFVTGHLLNARSALIAPVRALSRAENPWQRRLAIVTLIEAFRSNAAWRPQLESIASELGTDRHPLVRKGVVWARDRLAKDSANV